jgi:diguanylate cyclase (GGDEF)-like protein/PAS domain S-box-containing protein
LSRGLVVRRSADGKPLRMIGTHVDVNERREREERLRLAASVFEIADEAVIVTDADNRIVSVNPAFEAITGYASEEAIGRNPSLLSAKTLPKVFYQEMWQSLLDSGRWSGEVLNRKKSGETYVEWLSIKRLLNDKGQPVHHVAVFSDISQRKQAEERMRHLALHDALTGLPNRSLLSDRLNQCLSTARRDKTRFALLYFDLDKFKPVNDKLGHDVGDALLIAVAQRVQECVRESDTVARIGGDEFVALLPKLQESGDAMRVAEKIRDALSRPFQVAGHVCEISASIGIALYPEHGEDEKQLTLIADAAMYQAKQNGRNCAVLYQAGKPGG